MQKKQRNKLILFGLIGLALILGLFLVFSESGMLHVYHLKLEKQELFDQISELKTENGMLKRQIDKLTLEDNYKEQVIRDELGLVKPDETIIMFKTPLPGQSGYK